jgi:hypothetical protein
MADNCIIYYDFNNIHFSSYFLTGFYQNTKNFQYKFFVSKKTPALLLNMTMRDKYKGTLSSICLFKAQIFKQEFYFCIDTRDSCEANINRGNGYHIPLLNKVKYYFKVNYNIDAINNDSNLRESANKIIPSLPFFSIKCPNLLSCFPRIIPCNAVGWKMRDILKRFKILRNMVPLEKIRYMRNSKKDFDLFFVMKYRNNKIHSEDNEFRYQIMKEILKCRNLNSFVGFTSNKKIDQNKYADLQMRTYSINDYLRYLSKSRIGIYVRGLHNCVSFKFGQLLALGLPIVGQSIYNNKENIMKNKYFREQFAYDKPKEIVEEAIKLLENKKKQITLGESNANVFDTKFSPKAVASNILRHIY